jgi:hypothetical protein
MLIRPTRLRVLLLLACLAAAALICVLAPMAFAQMPPGTSLPAGSPTLTPTVGVVMWLSMLLGLLNNWIQTGTVLGRWITPKAWLPDLTMIATALGGFLGYITSQTPVDLNGPALFYAMLSAVGALISGAAPTAALHFHDTLTQKRLAMRRTMMRPSVPPPPKIDPVTQAAASLAGGLLGVVLVVWGLWAACLVGCSAQQATQVENAVFSVDQVACIIANSGALGNSTAVQDIEKVCSLTPALEGPIQQLITTLAVKKAAAAEAGAK